MARVRPVCSIEGCGKPHKAHGLCEPHYRRTRTYYRPKRPLAEALPARAATFWERVVKTDGCWLWSGRRSRRGAGYGRFVVGNQTYDAHRLAWILTHGPVASGLEVCHHCDNPACVRPDHLFLGTHLENMLDREAKGRTVTPSRKLTAADVVAIRRRLAGGEAKKSVARDFGIGDATVGRIARRETWKKVA